MRKKMLRRNVSGMMLALLLTGMLTFVLDIQLIRAEPGTIIVPDDYYFIQDAVNHANPGDTIYVRAGTYEERVYIDSRSDIQIVGEDPSNTTIDTAWAGSAPGPFNVYDSSNITITGFTVTTVGYGTGIDLRHSQYCKITGNRILQSDWNIALENDCHHNLISNNTLVDGGEGVSVFSSWGAFPCTNNTIKENTFIPRYYHIDIDYNCADNDIYHNDFLNNKTAQDLGVNNAWDDGYPSGGNYWSNYAGEDFYSGPFQNITGSDGIGDTPHVIDADNTDRYPLMESYLGTHDIAVTYVVPSKTVVGQGYSLNINVTAANQGDYAETFNVTVYANTAVINQTQVTLTSGNSTTLTFTWNTSGFAYGNYTVSAVADTVQGETETADNTFIDGWVVVTISGDINGDFQVKPYDLALLIAAYGSDPYPPNPRPWNPNADINGDDTVGPYDLAVLIAHYGQHYP